MKILHVIPYASPIYGGPTVVAAQMATVLSAHGITIDVATTTAHGRKELDVPVDQPVLRDHARYFYFPRQGPKFWMFSWPLRQWLYQHVPDYDLVHVHGLFAYTTLPACAAAQRFGKPYVITPHGVLDPWCLSHKWWKKRPYYHLLARRNLQHASAVHATSSFEEAGLARLGFSAKTHVIPLSVDLSDSPVQHRYSSAPLTLLFLSRLDPIKGLPTLLRAVSILREHFDVEVQLKIAGQGEAEYVFELQTLVKRLKISENVKFIGFLQGEAKLQALAEADVFVLPSYHENFSLAAAEALAAGLPVIVSDQVGIAQDVANANAGSVVPVDLPELLAEAIMKYRSPDVRFTAGANARKLAEQYYSKERFGDALLWLYENVVADQSKSRVR